MKIVQTFWPGFSKKPEHIFQSSYGWLSPMHHYMSWALSVLQLREFYSDVVLHTTLAGKKILVDWLKLPYTQVIISHEHLPFSKKLWALSKIITYSMQHEAFIHVDGDIYIWKSFEEIKSAALCCQNLELGFVSNKNKLAVANTIGLELPDYMPSSIDLTPTQSTNAGLFGGTDISSIQAFSKNILGYYTNNKEIIRNAKDLDVEALNFLFEQIFLYYFAEAKRLSITTLLPPVLANNYTGFGDFEEIPHNKTFLHLLGSYKRNRLVSYQMTECLKNYHPISYQMICNFFPKDYAFWISGTTQNTKLSNRHACI